MRAICALFACVLAAMPAAAMEFKVEAEQLVLSGRIDGTELAKWRDITHEKLDARVDTVILRDSPGGDVWTALRIAEIVKDRGWRTAVSGYCLSACTLIFLGGSSRHFTDDRPVGLTRIGFHAAYAREDSLRSFKDSLNPQSAYLMRNWIRERTGGRMTDGLMDRFLGIENRQGFVYFFDSNRLRRKDGGTTFACTGQENPKTMWDECEKLADVTVYSTGVATSPQLIRSNDRVKP